MSKPLKEQSKEKKEFGLDSSLNDLVRVVRDGEMMDLCIGKLTITFRAFLSGVTEGEFVIFAESFYYEGEMVNPEDKKVIFYHSFMLSKKLYTILDKCCKKDSDAYYNLTDSVINRVIRDILSLWLTLTSIDEIAVLECELYPEWEAYTKRLINQIGHTN